MTVFVYLLNKTFFMIHCTCNMLDRFQCTNQIKQFVPSKINKGLYMPRVILAPNEIDIYNSDIVALYCNRNYI